ncbi:MAG: hypothetical protein AAGA09_05535 [Pseudomonadota bacterium]
MQKVFLAFLGAATVLSAHAAQAAVEPLAAPGASSAEQARGFSEVDFRAAQRIGVEPIRYYSGRRAYGPRYYGVRDGVRGHRYHRRYGAGRYRFHDPYYGARYRYHRAYGGRGLRGYSRGGLIKRKGY